MSKIHRPNEKTSDGKNKDFGRDARQPAIPIENLSDHQLIDAVKDGDKVSFNELVRRYRGSIMNYLYRFLNDYKKAVNLAEETFVRVFFGSEHYHTNDKVSTYIYSIATNLAVGEIRRRNRRRLVSLTGLSQFGNEDAQDSNFPDGQFVPGENLIESEQSRAVAREIAALPEKYRAPVILRDIEGKPYEEIARILEIDLGKTKSRVRRARELLRERLQKYFE